jgi:hypothetical protein
MKYKELWEQMCQRCDELDKKLADQEQPPIGFITNARHRLNFEPNAIGLKDMPKTIDWKIPVYVAPQPKQEQGEPVALKSGECWPEKVMQQWDYWRKEIANGHKGSSPRDWFESLSELKLIDTTPQPCKPLTDEQIKHIWESLPFCNGAWEIFARAIEAAHGIKE